VPWAFWNSSWLLSFSLASLSATGGLCISDDTNNFLYCLSSLPNFDPCGFGPLLKGEITCETSWGPTNFVLIWGSRIELEQRTEPRLTVLPAETPVAVPAVNFFELLILLRIPGLTTFILIGPFRFWEKID